MWAGRPASAQAGTPPRSRDGQTRSPRHGLPSSYTSRGASAFVGPGDPRCAAFQPGVGHSIRGHMALPPLSYTPSPVPRVRTRHDCEVREMLPFRRWSRADELHPPNGGAGTPRRSCRWPGTGHCGSSGVAVCRAIAWRQQPLELAVLLVQRPKPHRLGPLQAAVLGLPVSIVASDTPCRRARSAVFAPASVSFNTPMICASVNLVRFIVRPLQGPDSNHSWRKIRESGRFRKTCPTRRTSGAATCAPKPVDLPRSRSEIIPSSPANTPPTREGRGVAPSPFSSGRGQLLT